MDESGTTPTVGQGNRYEELVERAKWGEVGTNSTTRRDVIEDLEEQGVQI